MHRGGVDQVGIKASSAPRSATGVPGTSVLDWHQVDRALLGIKRSRCVLDAEEARWLREAEQVEIWRHLGMVSILDYLERRLEYAPRTAQDRMRVARALGALPQLTAALGEGALAYSAVRELSRVATPATEATWIAAATGKNLRQIEDMVGDHRPGDHPDDPPDPQVRTHVVRFDLSAETFALLRQARSVLDSEHGKNLPDDAFIFALCQGVLDGLPAAEPTGRAKFQIALTVCRRCRQGWQEGAGAQIAVGPDVVDRALCDAQHIGAIDGAAPERAFQDIAPSVARLVWRRDGGRCRIDGCRSARGLEIHHIVHRTDGGSHDALNLILTCSSCHAAHHAGLIEISGTADRLTVTRLTPVNDGGIARDAEPAAASDVGHTAGDVEAPAVAMGADPAGDGLENTRVPSKPGAHVGASPATEMGAPRREQANARATSVHCHGTPVTKSVATSVRRAHVVRATGCIDERRAHRTGPTDRPVCAPSDQVPAGTSAHVGADRLTAATLRAQARDALVGLGWNPAMARLAVADALAAAGGAVTLERLIFEALRRGPVPKV